jgi:hypothetical protein
MSIYRITWTDGFRLEIDAESESLARRIAVDTRVEETEGADAKDRRSAMQPPFVELLRR